MSYASVADFKLLGLPPKALDNVDATQIQAALDAGAAEMDTLAFGPSPDVELPIFAPFPMDVKLTNVRLAIITVMGLRGFQPGGVDATFFLAQREMGEKWCYRVADGKAVPRVTDSSQPPGTYSAPEVTSNPPEGWLCP